MLNSLARTGSEGSVESLDSLDSFLSEFEVVDKPEAAPGRGRGRGPFPFTRPPASPILGTSFLPFPSQRQQATPTRATTNPYRTFRAASRQATGPTAASAHPVAPTLDGVRGGSPPSSLMTLVRPPAPTPLAESPALWPFRPAALSGLPPAPAPAALLQTYARQLDQDLGRTSPGLPLTQGRPPAPPTVRQPPSSEYVMTNPLVLCVPAPPPPAPLSSSQTHTVNAPPPTLAASGEPHAVAPASTSAAGHPDALPRLSVSLGRMPSEADSGGSSPLAPFEPFEGMPRGPLPSPVAPSSATGQGIIRTDREPFTLVQRPAPGGRLLSPPNGLAGVSLQGVQTGLLAMDTAGHLAREGLRKRDFESELLDRLLNEARGGPAGPSKPAGCDAAPPSRVPLRARDPCFGFSTQRILLLTAMFAFTGLALLLSYTGRQHGSWAFRGALSHSFFDTHFGLPEPHHHSAMGSSLGRKDPLPSVVAGMPDDPRLHHDHDHERERAAEHEHGAGEHEHAREHDADAPRDRDYERERVAVAPHLPDVDPGHHHTGVKAGLRLLLHIRPPAGAVAGAVAGVDVGPPLPYGPTGPAWTAVWSVTSERQTVLFSSRQGLV